MWVGIVGAAILFALGHLRFLVELIGQPPPELVALVIVGNLVPGLGFDWLYWRFGLEAAILSHALTHVFAVLAAAVAGWRRPPVARNRARC